MLSIQFDTLQGGLKFRLRSFSWAYVVSLGDQLDNHALLVNYRVDAELCPEKLFLRNAGFDIKGDLFARRCPLTAGLNGFLSLWGFAEPGAVPELFASHICKANAVEFQGRIVNKDHAAIGFEYAGHGLHIVKQPLNLQLYIPRCLAQLIFFGDVIEHQYHADNLLVAIANRCRRVGYLIFAAVSGN